jgi:hypothetical protein
VLTAREVANALYGLKRLLRLDSAAIGHFGTTAEAFWNSFWVALWVLPIYALEGLFAYMQAPDPSGPLMFALVKLLTYAIGWVLFPLVMIRVADWMNRWPQYFRYMTVYNWFNLVVAVAYLPAVLFGGLNILPPGLVALYFLGIIIGFLVFSWWIAVHGLKVTGASAVGIVLLDSLLSLVSMRVLEVFIGRG